MGRFYLSDGRVISNTLELALAIEGMDYKTFVHHVNAERNDFADWLAWRGDKELAEKVRCARSRTEIELILLRHLVNR